MAGQCRERGQPAQASRCPQVGSELVGGHPEFLHNFIDKATLIKCDLQLSVHIFL